MKTRVLHRIELRMKIWYLEVNSNVRFEKTMFLFIFCLFFVCFQYNRCVSVNKSHILHINAHFSVSWGEMRSWVVLGEKDILSEFSDENSVLHGIQLRLTVWCLESKTIILDFGKLCSLSYLSFFVCFQCKKCFSVKKFHIFHMNPLFSVSWGEMLFCVLYWRERDINWV